MFLKFSFIIVKLLSNKMIVSLFTTSISLKLLFIHCSLAFQNSLMMSLLIYLCLFSGALLSSIVLWSFTLFPWIFVPLFLFWFGHAVLDSKFFSANCVFLLILLENVFLLSSSCAQQNDRIIRHNVDFHNIFIHPLCVFSGFYLFVLSLITICSQQTVFFS